MVYPVAACRGRLCASSAFTPASLPNFTTWFDPSFGVYTKDGSNFVPAVHDDPVFKWVSRNSESIYLEQATLANCPTYKLGANGMAFLEGNGTSARLEPNGLSVSAAPYSISVHARNGTAASSRLISNNSPNYVLGEYNQQIPRWFAAGAAFAVEGVTTTQAWRRFVANHSSTASPAGAHYTNGSADTITEGQLLSAPGAFRLFGEPAFGEFSNGRCGDLVVCSNVLSAGDIALLDAFMASREPT